MKIDEYVNRVLRKFWPEDEKGNRAVWFHSQNLNEDKKGNPKGLPIEGRSWLSFGKGKREHELRFEWSFRAKYQLAGVSLKTDGDTGGLQLHAGLFPTSLWLTLPIRLPRLMALLKKNVYGQHTFMDVHVATEDVVLRWQFGGNDFEWSNKTPKWKNGSFNLSDFALGRRDYEEGEAEVHSVKIPMPEGAYDATVKLHTDTWRRARWFPVSIHRATIDVPVGIPFPGKGENSYDCGEDATYGFTGPVESLEDAIGKQVSSVLRNRRRYGGWNTKYPAPEVRAVEVAKRRAEAEKERAEEISNNVEATNAKPGKPGRGPRA